MSFELEEFWDEANRHLYCKYDIDDDTIVVINGDRAPWIKMCIRDRIYLVLSIYQISFYFGTLDIPSNGIC